MTTMEEFQKQGILSREQRMKLSGIMGDKLRERIELAKKEWSAAWEARAKECQVMNALEERVKKADDEVKFLEELARVLSW